MRFILPFALLLLMAFPAAAAKRVALVIGQNAYVNLTDLDNPKLDARAMAALLAKHGFEVISCDGKEAGCFDLAREGLLGALGKLEASAKGADMALVYFAGHGVATEAPGK